MRRVIAGGLGALLLAGAVQAQTVVVVRHAEKAAEPANDPGLTPAGEARALALAEQLKGDSIWAILTSPLRRTVLTAAPLAAVAGAPSRPVGFAGGEAAHVAEIVAAARAAPKDSTVVVVGHSNTAPAIARALGYADAPDIPDCRYDALWLIHLDGKAAVASSYGAPSAGC